MIVSLFQGKSLQFDQWRIAHLAEFGINNFDAPPTPAPTRPQEKTKTRPTKTPKTPKVGLHLIFMIMENIFFFSLKEKKQMKMFLQREKLKVAEILSMIMLM